MDIQIGDRGLVRQSPLSSLRRIASRTTPVGPLGHPACRVSSDCKVHRGAVRLDLGLLDYAVTQTPGSGRR
jgi:hypothetical protein